MKRSIYTIFAFLVLIGGLAFIGASASAGSKNCKNGLVPGAYDCNYLLEGNTVPRPMVMWFTRFSGPEATGPELFLSGPEISGPETGGHMANCACTAKKTRPSDPNKVGFREGKAFECLTLSGADFAGPENFNFGAAAYHGVPSKGKVQKGQAVDANGNVMVFDCVNDD